ncbi:MAG: MOSC domain-containing protein [Mycobacterium sp.]
MTGATVGRLWHYPVKSMQGQEVQEVLVGPGGVAGDRAYGFVDVETGRLASAKRPKRFGPMLDCHARFQAPPGQDGPPPPIEVTFPDGAVVRGDSDDGAELTRRTQELLGREVRLITTVPDGLAFDELWPDIDGLGPDALVNAMQIEPPDSHGDRVVQFPVAMAAPGTMLDLAALHVLAASTLRRLAGEHPEGDWDPRRMRPNMLIDDVGEPADEDDWLGCDLHIGTEAVVHVVGPTPRCVMTTLAQPGLPRDGAVLKTIARVGLKQIGAVGQFACVGSYAEVVTPGVVRRGDPVRIERVQPRQGALSATMEMMAAALSAGSRK